MGLVAKNFGEIMSRNAPFLRLCAICCLSSNTKPEVGGFGTVHAVLFSRAYLECTLEASEHVHEDQSVVTSILQVSSNMLQFVNPSPST